MERSPQLLRGQEFGVQFRGALASRAEHDWPSRSNIAHPTETAGAHTFRQAVRRRVREYRARNVRIQDLCRRPLPALNALNNLRS